MMLNDIMFVGLMSVISAAAMAADGMQAMGMRHAGDWEASQLDAALASGGFGELVGHLGGTDWPIALGSSWRGPKGSHKRPGYGKDKHDFSCSNPVDCAQG